MKARRAILILALVGFCALGFCVLFAWRPYHIPLWAAFRARHRIEMVHPGMTETKFWDVLGLSSYDFFKGAEGSGPPNSFPMNYRLWYGHILYCRWDMRSHPMVLVEARFKRRMIDP